MPNEALPDADLSVHPADLKQAGAWWARRRSRWDGGSIVLVVVGCVVLVMIHAKTASSGAVARHSMSAR